MSDITNSALEQPAAARRHVRGCSPSVFSPTRPMSLIVVAYALIFPLAAQHRAVFRPATVPSRPSSATAIMALPVLLLAVIIIEFYRMVRYDKPKQPDPGAAAQDQELLPCRTVAGRSACRCSSSCSPSCRLFADIKARIPAFVPFSWDRTFDELDRVVHFGTRPWEWLQPVLGYAPITFLINLNYNFWFFAMWMFWAWFAWQEKPGVNRTRAFFSFMLIWAVGGSLFAIVFSSAGPCYFGRLGLSPDPYAPLMTYLDRSTRCCRSGPSIRRTSCGRAMQMAGCPGHFGDAQHAQCHDIAVRARLLAFGADGPRRSPSRHMVLIFLGSIHLGWHYAVDAYVAWASDAHRLVRRQATSPLVGEHASRHAVWRLPWSVPA